MGSGIGGQCETHQLPLDARGECELCRLDAIPSKPPPSRATSWVVVGGAVLLVGGVIFAFGAAPDPDVAQPKRGVDIVQIGFSPESLEYKLNQAVRTRLYR